MPLHQKSSAECLVLMDTATLQTVGCEAMIRKVASLMKDTIGKQIIG
ncbi:MAG: hypothetical protein HC827_15860 [Cyanobacteria bacterium RM1_2_2]|nr:hypothetical protein [Cyanobacteria bacterium RM1_2_2]